MIGVDVAMVGCGLAAAMAAVRIARGPTPADRVLAADLLAFAVIALLALAAVRLEVVAVFDVVLVATLVAFLSALALARLLDGGWR